MKTFLLLVSLLPLGAFSQVTIQSSDFADGGDTVRMSTTTDATIDFASTGANHSWDFSAMIPESQTLQDYIDISNASSLSGFLFGGFAPTKYQANYFIASDALPLDQIGGILPVSIEDIFQFSKITADSITSIGFSISVQGTEIPFRSDTIEARYKFPLDYQDTYTARGYTNMDLNPVANIIWRQHRLRESEVDGWGTLVVPMGTYNVLRVRHTIYENDSIMQDFFGSPIWVGFDLPTSYIYEWLAPGEKESILRIQTSEVGGSEVVTGIEYRDTYNAALASVEEQTISEVTLYPNPAVNALHVEGNSGAPFMITDLSGKSVLEGVVSNTGSVSVSELTSGNYIFLVKNANGWQKATFVKH